MQYVDFLRGVAQGCTLSPDLFTLYIHEMIVAVEPAARSHADGRYDVAVMFADDFVRMSETHEALQKQIEKSP